VTVLETTCASASPVSGGEALGASACASPRRLAQRDLVPACPGRADIAYSGTPERSRIADRSWRAPSGTPGAVLVRPRDRHGHHALLPRRRALRPNRSSSTSNSEASAKPIRPTPVEVPSGRYTCSTAIAARLRCGRGRAGSTYPPLTLSSAAARKPSASPHLSLEVTVGPAPHRASMSSVNSTTGCAPARGAAARPRRCRARAAGTPTPGGRRSTLPRTVMRVGPVASASSRSTAAPRRAGVRRAARVSPGAPALRHAAWEPSGERAIPGPMSPAQPRQLPSAVRPWPREELFRSVMAVPTTTANAPPPAGRPDLLRRAVPALGQTGIPSS
jgi:hypothetical protein